jgi:hypothetical protein
MECKRIEMVVRALLATKGNIIANNDMAEFPQPFCYDFFKSLLDYYTPKPHPTSSDIKNQDDLQHLPPTRCAARVQRLLCMYYQGLRVKTLGRHP